MQAQQLPSVAGIVQCVVFVNRSFASGSAVLGRLVSKKREVWTRTLFGPKFGSKEVEVGWGVAMCGLLKIYTSHQKRVSETVVFLSR